MQHFLSKCPKVTKVTRERVKTKAVVKKTPPNCLTPSPRRCLPMIGAKLVIHSALLTGQAQLAKFLPAPFFYIQIGVHT